MNSAAEQKKTAQPLGERFSKGTRLIELPGDYGTGDFILKRGGKLSSVTVAYESWGELSDNHDNVILLLTGLSTSAHACSSIENPEEGWWEYMIGPGKPIDTNRFYVICVNSLGGCFGTTGPSSINPKTGKPYDLDFPEITIEDIAKAAHHAMVELDIEHLHAVIGASMGGMTALAYALQYPDELCYLVSISAAARALPFTIAMRSLQREIIRRDPKWAGGNYDPENPPLTGQRLARKLGMITYRSSAEWTERFGREQPYS